MIESIWNGLKDLFFVVSILTTVIGSFVLIPMTWERKLRFKILFYFLWILCILYISLLLGEMGKGFSNLWSYMLK